MTDDFDFDPASPDNNTRQQSLQRPSNLNFNPVYEQSAPTQQAYPYAHGQAKSKRPVKRTKLPQQLARCEDCFELRAAYRYLLEQEREMKKILREKQLQVKKQADLLVKADAPDTRGKQIKEYIRVLESYIALAYERINSIVVGDVEAEKQRYIGERSKQEEEYLRFLGDLDAIRYMCYIVQLQTQNAQKQDYIRQLKDNMEKKKSGKIYLHRVEVKNTKNQIIACRYQINDLKLQRQRNYEEIIKLYNRLVDEFGCDLYQLFSGYVYEFRYLDLYSNKDGFDEEVRSLISVEQRPRSPPGDPAPLEIEGFYCAEPEEPVDEQQHVAEQPSIKDNALAEQLENALAQEDVQGEADFDESDGDNVEDTLMRSIK